jgi:hypothetical protein
VSLVLRTRTQLVAVTDPVEPFAIVCLNCFNQTGAESASGVDIVQDPDDRATVTLCCQTCCAVLVVSTEKA